MLVWMVSYMDVPALPHDADLLEFFSGSARISRLSKGVGYKTIALDILYDSSAPPPKTKKKDLWKFANPTSALDLNTSAGFVSLCEQLFRTCRLKLMLGGAHMPHKISNQLVKCPPVYIDII